jgi:hypothetical protein
MEPFRGSLHKADGSLLTDDVEGKIGHRVSKGLSPWHGTLRVPSAFSALETKGDRYFLKTDAEFEGEVILIGGGNPTRVSYADYSFENNGRPTRG